ncbi:MAG: aminotransferase class V-fold PLP-dependent enzyme [Bacteroidia bacterium]|nr:aminotransferase class V-fold PLP-dependent enzyme [Bacteroidia bacterium]
MDILDIVSNRLKWLPKGVARFIEKKAKAIPSVQKTIEKETAGMLEEIEAGLKPYRGKFPVFPTFPKEGRSREEILAEMEEFNKIESPRWADGYVSGAVYHGDPEHIDFLNQVYALNSQSNPLHSDLWPSATKFEAEIVSMTAHMMGKGQPEVKDDICGSVSSGGTESICLAMKTYRDWARETKGITAPEMILPTTAHAAFDKAAHYYGIKQVRIPIGEDFRADLKALKNAITPNTIVIVGSAPAFPHGIVDPIEEMSEMALAAGVGFHTDSCLGGFVLPWAEQLGYAIEKHDFRLPGVTSMSVDTHKYGYAAKGTSVVLYRNPELRQFQYYTTTEWPGGLYFSPTFAGSRPGALSAACWAAMVSIGEKGYLEASDRIMKTAIQIKEGIRSIPELRLLGDPHFVIAFASDQLNIYRVSDEMTHKGWNLNGLHKPSCIHLAVTLRHTQEGVADRFIADLKASVAEVIAHPKASGGNAPVYGMAANIPFRGMVSDILKKYMDAVYKV